MSLYTCDYTVYGLNMLEGIEVTGLMAYLDTSEDACRLARYCIRSLGIDKSEVYLRNGFGDYELIYSITKDEYCRDEVLESLLQLRDAGVLMPDPEDSPFFATPCAPMAAV